MGSGAPMTDLVHIERSKYIIILIDCYQVVDSEQKKDHIGDFDNKQDAMEVNEF